MTAERINTEYHVEAMVAPDTIDLLAQRVIRILSYGRRITTTSRYTWVNDPPEVLSGLTLYREPRLWRQGDGSAGFTVELQPGLMVGFGFAVYTRDGIDSEAKAWRRYHDGEPTKGDLSCRRRNITLVQITGGREGDGPGRSDRIVILPWNDDGVCEERVIVFDPTRCTCTRGEER